MKKNYLVFIYFILFLTILSCKKDLVVVVPNIECTTTLSNLSVVVFDENRHPLSDVTVQLGDKSVQTNKMGLAYIQDAQVCSEHTIIKVNKNGYFEGLKSFIPTPNTNILTVTLIPKTLSATILSTAGGTVNFNGGGSLVLPVEGYAYQDGTLYTGSVKVYTYALSPDDAQLSQKMPGNLSGFQDEVLNGINPGYVCLKTYGMVAVNLEDESGAKLNLASGKSAKINLPVPNNLSTDAPQNIPMWHFDEQDGLWKNDGSAVLHNGVYTGEVRHFSWWNFDLPVPSVLLSATFLDGVNPYSGTLTLTSSNWGTISFQPDNTGYFNEMIPAGELLELSYIDNCGQKIFIQNIGPFTTDTNLGNINVPQPTGQTITISGTVTDCNNLPMSSGLVVVLTQENVYQANVSNGAYSMILTDCQTGGQLNIYGFDTATGNFTITQNFVASAGLNIVDLGGCNTEPGGFYANLQVGDTSYLYFGGHAAYYGTIQGTFIERTWFHYANTLDGREFNMQSDLYVNINQLGSYGLYLVTADYSEPVYHHGTIVVTDIYRNFTTGGYITGYFYGADTLNGQPVSFRGSFKMRYN